MKFDYLVFSAIGILLAAGLFYGTKDLKKRNDLSQKIGEGLFDHALHHHASSTRDLSHKGVSIGFPSDSSFSIIHMKDGSSFVLRGLRDMPFHTNDLIEILEDGFGRRTVRKVEEIA